MGGENYYIEEANEVVYGAFNINPLKPPPPALNAKHGEGFNIVGVEARFKASDARLRSLLALGFRFGRRSPVIVDSRLLRSSTLIFLNLASARDLSVLTTTK